MNKDVLSVKIDNLITTQNKIGNKIDKVQDDITDIKVGMQKNKDRINYHDKQINTHSEEIKNIKSNIENNQSGINIIKWFFSRPKKKVILNFTLLIIASIIVVLLLVIILWVLSLLGILPNIASAIIGSL